MTFNKSSYDHRIEFRVTKGQRKLVEKMATEYGLTVADFIRYCITKTAEMDGYEPLDTD